MYKSVISFQENLSTEKLKQLVATADLAFDNRAGKIKSSSISPFVLSYEGEENAFACLNLGLMSLWDNKEFLMYVKSWMWIDEEEPDESCDVLKEMAIPVK